MKPQPIAVLCSDLHLTLAKPACRADKDWLEVQCLYLAQLTINANTYGQNLPIICAGDLFDRWNPSPELINFALKYLPDGMLCVPGQHDLPNHNISDMHRSGYGVLKEAGKIADLTSEESVSIATQPGPGGCEVYGFGWNQPITPPDPDWKANGVTTVAVIHRYVWTKGASFPGAPETANVGAMAKDLAGYDVAVFGDNHSGFTAKAGKCMVWNCGGFLRRRSDEITYRPRLGILYSDGTVKPHYLDTKDDKFHEMVSPGPETAFDMQGFIQRLENLGEHGLDFRAMVKNYLESEKVEPETRQIIKEALDEV